MPRLFRLVWALALILLALGSLGLAVAAAAEGNWALALLFSVIFLGCGYGLDDLS